MLLVSATGVILDQVLEQTFPLWNEGLTREGYGRWNRAQMRLPWARRGLDRVALVDRGRVLASAKRYWLRARLDDRDVLVIGIGALFTPEPERGHGHASAIVEAIVDEARRDGVAFAMLFSEIGPAFYERLSFHPVVLDDVRVETRLEGGAPAMLVRGGHERDLPALAALHDVRSTPARFALRRDAAQIQFALARKRLLAGLGPPGARQVEFHVVEEGASAVAYAIIMVDQHGWTLSEAGDRDPAAARLGALLQVLHAREPSQRPPVIRAWWPRSFPVPPQLRLVDRRDARDLLMIRPLVDVRIPTAEETFYWRSDFF
jgi:GNAT superfamily N-acetyltransferase